MYRDIITQINLNMLDPWKDLKEIEHNKAPSGIVLPDKTVTYKTTATVLGEDVRAEVHVSTRKNLPDKPGYSRNSIRFLDNPEFSAEDIRDLDSDVTHTGNMFSNPYR